MPIGPSGNINLYTRPRIKNPDGSVSTVRSMSFGDSGKEILVPTTDEKTGKGILSNRDAIEQYYKTKKHLGIFSTPDEATEQGEKLHNAFERGDYDVPLASSRKGIAPDKLSSILARFLRLGPTGVE